MSLLSTPRHPRSARRTLPRQPLAAALSIALMAWACPALAADAGEGVAPGGAAAVEAVDAADSGAASGTGAAVTLGTVSVTGTRGNGRTLEDSAVPVDIITGEQLERLGGSGITLKDAIEKLAPSFTVNTRANATFGTVSRPAGLRGFGGAHVLVLVNGKRRHGTSLPNINADSQAINATPVDLDMIPISSIDRIEILRDGAAAQYGSDAIAGVINLILKSDDRGGRIATTLGQRYKWEGRQDGETYKVSTDAGFKLGADGFVHLAAEATKQDWTLRVAPSKEQLFSKLPGGAPDPRETTVDRRVFRGGTPKLEALNLAFNAALPLENGLTPYAFGTFGRRNAELGQSYRREITTNVIPELLAGDVLQPTTFLHETDYEVVAGLKGRAGEWDWDLSSGYGRNEVDLYERNSVNPSLGLASPTHFRTWTPITTQWVTNLDVTRPYEVGLSSPLQVSWGLEHRYERFETIVRDASTYANGDYLFPSGPLAGQPGAIGAQAAVIVLPEDAADLERNSDAAYVDLGVNLTAKWYVAGAARYEHYDDSAGSTRSGKLTTRYDFNDRFAVRGTVSNGFRAPSLAQSGFASGSQGPFIVNGAIAGITTSRNATPGSALGQALGATPLKPEKSVNASVGFTFNTGGDLTLDVDAYRIALNDRVGRTTVFRGAGISAILAANGLDPNQSVSYNTNAIDTLTQGIDVVGTLKQDYRGAGFGKVDFTLGYNYNKTTVEDIKQTPAQLATLGLTLFDRVAISNLTVVFPRTKLALGADWQLGDAWRINLRETRYGSVEKWTDNPAFDQHYSAKWITDLEVEYAATASLKVALGANNLFDTYPDESTIPDVIGAELYATNSPFGGSGGFYYLRATYAF